MQIDRPGRQDLGLRIVIERSGRRHGRQRLAQFGGTVDIGTITIGCALGYLDFRYADMTWPKGRPKLAKWFEGFNARPSMKATMPVG